MKTIGFSLSPATLPLLAALAASPALAVTSTTPVADLGQWTCVGNCGASVADGDITLSPVNSPKYGYVTTAGSGALGVFPLALNTNSTASGTQTNGSRYTSNSFSAVSGQSLNVQFNFVSTDGKGYDDIAWARIVNAGNNSTAAWLFAAQSTNSGSGNIIPGNFLPSGSFDPDAQITAFKDFEFNTRNTKNAPPAINWSLLGGSNGTCWREDAKGCGFTGWLESKYEFTANGSYRLEIGVANWGDQAFDSGMAFDFQGLTAPVPEPETYTMLLAGLGIIAGIARRRSEASRRQ